MTELGRGRKEIPKEQGWAEAEEGGLKIGGRRRSERHRDGRRKGRPGWCGAMEVPGRQEFHGERVAS